MNDLVFFFVLVLNTITAIVFFNLGKTGKLPTMPKVIRRREEKSNFVDNDLEDIRDVDPQLIMKSFMDSIKKKPPVVPGMPDSRSVEKDFEEFIN